MASGIPSGLQDWIHKLEEGEWARYLKVGVALLGLVALAVIYDVREFKNIHAQEAMDAAQLGRSLAEGEGFTTRCIRPFTIFLMTQIRGKGSQVLDEPHPDMVNPPVYPLLLAGLFKTIPMDFAIADPSQKSFRTFQPEIWIAVMNQIFFAALLAGTFLLARRLFDSTVAWLTLFVLAGANLLWQFSVSGLSTLLVMLQFMVLVLCLTTMERHQREGTKGAAWFVSMAVIAGVVLGLMALTRYALGWLVLPAAAFFGLYFGTRRLALIGSMLAAFALLLAPWMVRNYQVSGYPFGMATMAVIQDTYAFPGDRLPRVLTEQEYQRGINQLGTEDYLRKLVVNASDIIVDALPRLGGSWISALFLVGLLVPFLSPALTRLRVFTVSSLLVLAVVQALGRTHLSDAVKTVNSENLLVVAVPLVFMFGAAMFVMLLDRFEWGMAQLRTAALTAFVLVMSAPLFFQLMPPRSHPLAYPPYYPPLIQEVAQWMDEGELTMSDMPWALAWYGKRPSVLVTLEAPTDHSTDVDFFVLHDFQKPVRALYLTPMTIDGKFLSEMLKGKEWAWGRFVLDCLLKTNVPTGFPLRYAPGGFLPDQLFLTDRERWHAGSKEQ